MSSSVQDYWPRKVATGSRARHAAAASMKPARSMDSLGVTQRRELLQQTAATSVPRIDLANFDSPEYDGLDYVLTSPRSLEACHRLGVRPVQLLYKRLQDFELENPGLPVARLFELYDRHEAKRKESLRLAREERERLMLLALDGGEDGDAARSYGWRRQVSLNGTTESQGRQSRMANGSGPVRDAAAGAQGVAVAWESQVRRELEDHEAQAERLRLRLRLRLESQRLRRLEESKARRDRELRLAEEETRARHAAQQEAASAAANWEARHRQAESRRLQEDRQAVAASQASLRDLDGQQEKARRAKSALESDEIRRRHLRLKRKEEAHRQRSEGLRKAAAREAESTRDSTERRQRSAVRNAELAQEKRQLSLREQQLMQLERYRSSAERRKHLEAEIDDYKEELRQYRQVAEQRAEDAVNRRAHQLAGRAAAKEAQRQSVARRNQREQERAEEAWRRQVEAQAVARQDEAARQQVARERDRQNARAVAETAARLRDGVRRGEDTFDKKVAQVNLVNRLGLGHEIRD